MCVSDFNREKIHLRIMLASFRYTNALILVMEVILSSLIPFNLTLGQWNDVMALLWQRKNSVL